MQLFPIKTRLITKNDNILKLLIYYLGNRLQNKDIVVISSKIIALTQRRIISRKTFNQILKKEADQIFSLNPPYLTLKNNIFTPNAGADSSNAPARSLILWPNNLEKNIKKIHQRLLARFQISNLGLVIADSTCQPLRNGVSAIALCCVGFKGVTDERGKKDLFQKKLKITKRNMADMLANAASILMGEANEKCPFVIIRNAPVQFVTESSDKPKLTLEAENCLFAPLYPKKLFKLKKKAKFDMYKPYLPAA